ncbi:MAG TPA: 4-hydroxyphenylpyruvate dioxygenase [Bacilli bacterium]|nr:4-hydroxyphenylpyruvate dioxygenase [Bacilli bacterium]
MQKPQTLPTHQDTLPIQDIDHIELYVGNAKQTAFYLCKLLGLQIIAYSGLETGNRDRASYVLQGGDIHILISAAYHNDHPIARFVAEHGDGVKDIALRVTNLEQTYTQAITNGGIPNTAPYTEHDAHGTVQKAVLGTYGDLTHTLIDRENYQGAFLPGYQPVDEPKPTLNTRLTRIDHLALNVENMNQWTDFYERVFGFNLLREFNKEDVSSDTSSLMTKAMQNGSELVKFPIVEPAPGKKKSQVQEFLDYNSGPGVQHIALLTDDILTCVEQLQQNGIQFLYTPDTYYDMLPARVGDIDEPLPELNRLNILVDRDHEGYLLQIFAQPIHDRPTLFFEIIQRKGSRGFGNGNIRALFQAVEREQARRGNL